MHDRIARGFAFVGLVGTVALGIASRKVHLGIAFWDKSLGDVLYTVMIGFLVRLARPSKPPVTTGLVALATSVAMELFQLTGVPARAPHVLRWVLGTTFAWHDVACYVVGAALVTGLFALQSRSTRKT